MSGTSLAKSTPTGFGGVEEAVVRLAGARTYDFDVDVTMLP